MLSKVMRRITHLIYSYYIHNSTEESEKINRLIAGREGETPKEEKTFDN